LRAILSCIFTLILLVVNVMLEACRKVWFYFVGEGPIAGKQEAEQTDTEVVKVIALWCEVEGSTSFSWWASTMHRAVGILRHGNSRACIVPVCG